MTNPIEIIGELVFIYPTEEITDKFQKRRFKVYVENFKNPKYSDIFELELKQDKCDMIDQFELGETIECKCSLSGRDWVDSQGRPVHDKRGRQINSITINCWHIGYPDKDETTPEENEEQNNSSDIQEDELEVRAGNMKSWPEDDLPF